MSIANLRALYEQADRSDREEGKLAYPRYNALLREIAKRHQFPFASVVAAFVALSPNNDYVGNLRSLISVLKCANGEYPLSRMTISTYKACGLRAHSYLRGAEFLVHAKGPKIRSFYFNIIEPLANGHVTIDGHMAAAYRGNAGTMKQNIVKLREYREIAEAVKKLAAELDLVPNQLQATLWFARKRILNVKYDPQLDLLSLPDDVWKVLMPIDEIRPYPPKPIDQFKEVMAQCL